MDCLDPARPAVPPAASSFERALDALSAMFVPLVPALAGAGMLQALLSVLAFAGMDAASTEFRLIDCFAQATFFFLPLMLAHTAADRLGANPYVAVGTVGALLMPALVELVDGARAAGEGIAFLGLPVAAVTYSSTVFPALLIVCAQAWIERVLIARVPDVLRGVVVPACTMAALIPLSLAVLGPLGAYAGEALYRAIAWLYGVAPWFVPALVGAITPACVMTGMHFAGLVPLTVMLLAASGVDNAVGPGMLASNFAIGGACAAVALQPPDARTRALGVSTGIQAVLGIAEPALYGVMLPLRTPFAAAVLGGAAGGVLGGILGVGRYAQAGNSVIAWASYIGPGGVPNLLGAIALSVLGFAVALIAGLGMARMRRDRPKVGRAHRPGRRRA